MKCANPKCELISLVLGKKCPECGSEMKRIKRASDTQTKDESVKIVDNAFV